MGLLNRKKLLEKEKIEVVKVDLDDENFIFVCQMTGRARDQFERSLFDYVDKPGGGMEVKRKMGDFRSKLLVNTICDEKGTLLLRPSDYEELSQSMSAATIDKIVEASQKLNAITEEDKEELLKNSKGGPAADSSSDSVEN
jgi:hypothetical protein